jgi:hypothetical protein
MRLPTSVALLAALLALVPARSHAQTASASRPPLAALSRANTGSQVVMAMLAALTTWLGVRAGQR